MIIKDNFILTDLELGVSNDGRERTLLIDYIYSSIEYEITVMKSFTTDGASIPRIFWSILGSPFYGVLLYAAIIHDGLYTAMVLERRECDRILKKISLDLSMNVIQAYTIWAGVRIGGWLHWKKDTSANAHLIKIVKK